MANDWPDQANAGDRAAVKATVKTRSRMLPLWGWVLLAGYAAAVAYIRNIDDLDGAYANILTLICTFLTCSAMFVWFCFYSGFSRATRRTALVAAPSIIIVLIATLRIEGVRGGLWPEWSWRWTPRPDQLLAAARPAVDASRAPMAAAASDAVAISEPGGGESKSAAAAPGSALADLNTTTPEDFPQFLGPQRSGWIPGPALDADWSKREPKLLWRQPIGAGWSAFSVVNGYAVTLEQRGEDELTTCYELLSGRLIWSHAERTLHATTLGGVGPRSTPTLFRGKVYSLGATGILNCLDGASGAVLWRRHLLEEYQLTPEVDMQSVAWGRAASPLVVDELVIVPAGGPPDKRKVSLVAFDSATGAKAWEAGDDQIAYASPALGTVSGVRQVLSVNERTVSGHDPETGKVFWSFPWEGKSNDKANNSQPVVVGADRVFVSKGYADGKTGGAALMEVACDDAGHWTTKPVWIDPRVMKTKFSNVVMRDGFVYGLSDGTLECLATADGKRQWKHGRYGHGQILGVGEMLIVQAESGEVFLVAIDPRSHRELGRLAALDGKTWNNLALYGRYLLVRNAEHAACFELPLDESPSPKPSVTAR